MLENGKISAVQLACMVYLSVFATGILTAPSRAYELARIDFWVAPILASITAFALVAMMHRMHKLYPGNSFVQYSEKIVGTAAGKLLSFLFLTTIVFQNGQQTRQFADIMVLNFFQETPSIFLVASILAISAITVRLGVEVIGRSALLLTPVIILITLLLIFPLINDLELDRILPVFKEGMVPLLRGAFFLQIWFPMYAITTFYIPFVHDISQSAKWSLLSVSWTLLTYSGAFLIALLILGSAVPVFNFPFMVLTRYVVLFSFFSRFDSLIMVLWVLDVFIRSIMMHYACSIGFAQFFGVSDYRPLVIPLALFMAVFGYWSFPTIIDFYSGGGDVIFIYFTAYFIIPGLVFLVALLRRIKPANQDKLMSPPSAK